MNVQTYQENAKRTVNWDLSYKLQLAGFSLGITGELEELKKAIFNPGDVFENIKDEGGDVCWYVVNMCSLLNIDWTTMFPEMPMPNRLPLFHLGEAQSYNGELADVLKKHTVQDHMLDRDKVYKCIRGIIASLFEIFAYFRVTPDDVCEFNYQKLLKRYPNGFESKRSIYREV